MKTITASDVKRKFKKLLSWIEDGNEVVVTVRRKAVARIIPIQPSKIKKPSRTDFVARQKSMFTSKISAYDLLKEERDSYQW